MKLLVDSPIARGAGEIRRKYKTKTPDALIASTAVMYQAPLVTRNVRDFKKIKELKVLEI